MIYIDKRNSPSCGYIHEFKIIQQIGAPKKHLITLNAIICKLFGLSKIFGKGKIKPIA